MTIQDNLWSRKSHIDVRSSTVQVSYSKSIYSNYFDNEKQDIGISITINGSNKGKITINFSNAI